MSTTKLERPPYVHNWARYNYSDVEKTTKELVRFATGMPQITYAAALPIVHDRIALGLDRDTAMVAALSKGAPKSRPHVASLVGAFFDYDEVRRYSGSASYDQFVQPFRASRDIQIPVKPLLVIAENGQLKPLFLVGWSSMPLDTFQRRLLMTIVEDAVFSLTDFQASTGEFISFPKNIEGVRKPEIWQRGDYALLSSAELTEQVSIYLSALAAAKLILKEKPAKVNERPRKERDVYDGPMLDFDKPA